MTYAEIISAVIANKKVFYQNENYEIIRKGEDLYIRSIINNHMTYLEPYAGNLKSYYIEGSK